MTLIGTEGETSIPPPRENWTKVFEVALVYAALEAGEVLMIRQYCGSFPELPAISATAVP